MDLNALKITPNKKLHSREHMLAEDLSKMLGETKLFAAYLGIAKLYHESDLRALLRYILEKENLPHEVRGKYFFAAVRGLAKKPAVKLKRAKQKRHKKLSKKS